MVETRSNIPVNASYIIALLVLPDLTECNSSPLKGAVVLTGKDMPGQASGLYLYPADFFQ